MLEQQDNVKETKVAKRERLLRELNKLGDTQYGAYNKSIAFDLIGFHSGPKCICSLVPGYGGIGIKIWCGTCHIIADVEAVGIRIAPAKAGQAREEG